MPRRSPHGATRQLAVCVIGFGLAVGFHGASRAEGVSASALSAASGRPAVAPAVPGPTALDAGRLASVLPDRVAGYRAIGPAVTVELAVASGGRLPRASRGYTDGTTSLVLEVIDPLHAPAVLSAVRAAQHQVRQTPDRMLAGMAIGEQWVMTQWTAGDRSARVGALVADRLVYSLTVTPARSIEPGVVVASSLDYAAARALLD